MTREEIEATARTHRGLDEVARFAPIDEVVRQDELTLDVIVPAGGLFLVYEAT